ncbi:7 transmembrane sweet-taste receptor of 3 GCPR [Mactra antiquata]
MYCVRCINMKDRDILLVLLLMTGEIITTAVAMDQAQKALEYVFTINGNNCGAGTGEVLPLQFDVTAWNQYTDPAIRTANFLSKIIALNDGTLDSLTDEMLFLMVRNNVHGDSLIFGSAIAIEHGVYSKYDAFCPYAYKKNNTVHAHDISVYYNYLADTTEWYNTLKIKTWDNVTFVSDGIMYRQGNKSLPEETEVYPIAELEDGHWTNPYFDCGGGDIWMVTYSSPIFNVKHGIATFMGVATIDIEMTYIDINQCDQDGEDSTSGLDVFRGTHKCQATTKCIQLTGQGFTPGAYKCVCVDGFYFADKFDNFKAFSGHDIEEQYRKPEGIVQGMFRCVTCAEGCDACTDNSPCLHKRTNVLLISLMILNGITITVIIMIAFFIHWKRNELFFLHIVDATFIACSIRIWFMNIGFFIMYGSLVLKTWRISVIFSVGKKKIIRLPDSVLLQRLGIFILIAAMLLAAWNGSQPPEVTTMKTSDDLKFFICDYGPWEYATLGVRILFLLYGVYLCFTVRKAPAHFNESKHITWAVYNAIILGSFMKILSRAFISVVGPNMVLLFQFIIIQVFVTITMAFIFVPKFLAFKNKVQISPEAREGTIQTVTGRVKKQQAKPSSQLTDDDVGREDKAIQTDHLLLATKKSRPFLPTIDLTSNV